MFGLENLITEIFGSIFSRMCNCDVVSLNEAHLPLHSPPHLLYPPCSFSSTVSVAKITWKLCSNISILLRCKSVFWLKTIPYIFVLHAVNFPWRTKTRKRQNAAAITEEGLLTWLGSSYYFSILMSSRFMYTHVVGWYVDFWHAAVLFFPFGSDLEYACDLCW